MLGRLVVVVALAAGAITAPTNARAQDESGVWLSGGVGPGFGGCELTDLCSSGRTVGIAGYLGGGGTLSAAVRVGIEGVGWRQSASDTTREYVMGQAVVLVRPLRTVPLVLKGGVGPARYAQRVQGALMTANGFSLGLGATADLRLGSHFAFIPYVQYEFANGQAVKVNRLPLVDALGGQRKLDADMLLIGVGVRWQSGG